MESAEPPAARPDIRTSLIPGPKIQAQNLPARASAAAINRCERSGLVLRHPLGG